MLGQAKNGERSDEPNVAGSPLPVPFASPVHTCRRLHKNSPNNRCLKPLILLHGRPGRGSTAYRSLVGSRVEPAAWIKASPSGGIYRLSARNTSLTELPGTSTSRALYVLVPADRPCRQERIWRSSRKSHPTPHYSGIDSRGQGEPRRTCSSGRGP